MSILTLLQSSGAGSQQATATAAMAPYVAPSATATPGAVTHAATAVASHYVVPAASAAVGGVTRSTTAVDAHYVVPAASAANVITVSATAASAPWVVRSATATPGGVTRATTAVDAHYVVPPAPATPGGVTATVEPSYGKGVAWWQTIAASIVIGAITATATAAAANWVVPSAAAGEPAAGISLPFLSSASQVYAPSMPKAVLEFRESTTLRATRDVLLADTLTLGALQLTQAERDSITDWTVLRASWIANESVVVELDWFAVELPATGSTQVLALPLISGQPELFAPTLAHAGPGLQAITLPHIASLAELFAPSVPAYVGKMYSAGALVFARTLPMSSAWAIDAVTLSLEERALVTDWGALSGSVTADGDRVDFDWTEVEVPPAAPATGLAFPFLASGAQMFAPSMGVAIIEMPHLPSTAVLYAPSLPPIGSYAQLLEGEEVRATWALGLTPDLASLPLVMPESLWTVIGNWGAVNVAIVANGEQVQVSWIKFKAPGQAPLFPPQIPSGAQLYAPTLEHGGTTMLAPIASTAQLYPPTLSAQVVTATATMVSAAWTVPAASAADLADSAATAAVAVWAVPSATAAAGNITRIATAAVAHWVVRHASSAHEQFATATAAVAHWKVAGGRVVAGVRSAYVSDATRIVVVSPDSRRLEIGPTDRIVIVEEEP
jgi:hypothetical protein